jgi:uncharacterized protein
MDMTKDIAEKAIAFFIRQLGESEIDFGGKDKPQIIFYGGEPLINFDTLKYVARRINELRSEIPVLGSTEMTVITNGMLLTKDRIVKLDELGVTVSISIDGSTAETNEMRVDVSGKEIFTDLIAVLDLYKELGIKRLVYFGKDS